MRVEGFGLLAHLDLPLDGSETVLIGDNNTGKSTILRAIAFALGAAPARTQDLHVALDAEGSGRNPSERAVVDVRVEFVLDPDSPGSASEDEVSQAGAIAESLGDSLQVDEDLPYFVIRATAVRSVDGAAPEVARTFVRGWSTDPAESAGLPLGPRVGRDLLQCFAVSTLDEHRDLAADIRRRDSPWGRMMASLDLPPEEKASLEGELTDLGRRLLAAAPALSAAEAALHAMRDQVGSSVSEAHLEPVPVDIRDLGRSTEVMLSPPASAPMPIGAQGAGIRSLASIMLFAASAQALLDTSPHPVLPILLLEEPESHLHQQAQRAVVQLMRRVPGQCVIATHSPEVAASTPMMSLRALNRLSDGTIAAASPVNADGTPRLTTDEIIAAERFLILTNGHALFCRCVVVSEGESEYQMLPVFAQTWWSPGGHHSTGVAFAKAGGAQNVANVVRLLAVLAIPWIAFFDGDKGGIDGANELGAWLDDAGFVKTGRILTLPAPQDIEEHLAVYDLPTVELAITDHAGADALDLFIASLHGTAGGKNKPVRDYNSAGGRHRAAVDFCRMRMKGSAGDRLALRFSAFAENREALPPGIVGLFSAVDRLLES